MVTDGYPEHTTGSTLRARIPKLASQKTTLGWLSS
jgi:hypothetical protein